MLWTIEERDDDVLAVKYPYFEQPEPLTWTEGGTYVDTDVVFTQNVSHEWNHGLGEIVTALLEAGLELTGLAEHDSVPWNAFPGQDGADRRGRVAAGRPPGPAGVQLHAPGGQATSVSVTRRARSMAPGSPSR